MASFLFSLVAVFLCSLGARDQLILARLSQASGQGVPVLVTGAVTAVATAALMAFFGAQIAALLPPRAGAMLVAFALGAASVELALPLRLAAVREPTRSLGAIGLVLAMRQIGDAARFAVFAFAAATAVPLLAGAGGALGGVAAMGLGWSMGSQLEEQLPLKAIRRLLAGVLAITAIVIALQARGVLGAA